MRFLLVVPFHSGDRGQAERLGKWMSALSGGKQIGDRILFSATVTTEIKGIGDSFKGLFDEMKGIRQTFGPSLQHNENPWPKACNLQFLHTAKHIYENYPDIDAFYYFEPDNLPLTPDWYDKICADYEKQGKPFYGASASYIDRREGVEPFLDGQHMIGTGVYPRDAWKRITAYAEIERTQPNQPWDARTRDEVNPQCHFTKLIFNLNHARGVMEDGKGLTAICRPNLEKEFKRRLVIIPKECVVFHGCKDASLRLLVAKKLGIPQGDILTFAHAGDLGDIIYALPAIQAKGGGIFKLSGRGFAREPIADNRLAVIAPLLLEQSYLDDVRTHDDGYVDFDFRQFRVLHKKGGNLAASQADWIGATIDTSKPWLEISGGVPSKNIMVNRTARYHNELFPWDTVQKTLGKHLHFIGLPEEHEAFEDEFGTVDYVPTATLLDAGRLIKSSRLFIGNQSVCFAIAEGLKHLRIQETSSEYPDCIFAGESGTYCDNGSLVLPEMEEPESESFESFLKNPKFIKAVRVMVRSVIEEELK